MKNISYGLAAVFSLVVLISDANAEEWGKFETDSCPIEKTNIQNKPTISDNLFDEEDEQTQTATEKKKSLKKSSLVKRKNKKNKRKKH